ncbi:MAG: hypothetical protein BMS9Abin02_1993 [Anaerolineae bacterium]|nr:MAG: hypothetical protein BMS9Abin02_1993 [Anaerolineae bacterium]
MTQPVATFSISTFDEEIARPATPGTANIALYPAVDADNKKILPADEDIKEVCT